MNQIENYERLKARDERLGIDGRAIMKDVVNPTHECVP